MSVTVRTENEYEDLLGQWSDLESALGVVLGNPGSIQEFSHRIAQYDRWVQDLMRRDPDVGLYLLFQLACNSHVGYSASHSLICSTLCHLMATQLDLPIAERDSLVRAAFTMNIAMTALQDQLSRQMEKPSRAQQDIIRTHAAKGAQMLSTLGVQDECWVNIVAHHHDGEYTRNTDSALDASTQRLSAMLRVVDRYAAMISPRLSRAGRSAVESARSITDTDLETGEVFGATLIHAIGLYPPGTYVRMDNGDLGVVLRRSSTQNQPHVALIGDSEDLLYMTPKLHPATAPEPRIHAALRASSIREHVGHHLILQLGAKIGTST